MAAAGRDEADINLLLTVLMLACQNLLRFAPTQKINLRKYYPDFYNTDCIIEVPDEALTRFEDAAQNH